MGGRRLASLHLVSSSAVRVLICGYNVPTTPDPHARLVDPKTPLGAPAGCRGSWMDHPCAPRRAPGRTHSRSAPVAGHFRCPDAAPTAPGKLARRKTEIGQKTAG